MRVDHNDEIGKIYGDFTIIDYDRELSKQRKTTMVKCKCNRCGVITMKPLYGLQKGERTSCKECSGQFKVNPNDYIGKRFGLLEILEVDQTKSMIQKKTVFKCICRGSCGGNIVYVTVANINAGNVTSCGCIRKGVNSPYAITTLGNMYGNITAIEVDEEATKRHGNREIYYKGRCKVGHVCTYSGSSLRNRHICPMCGE